MGGGLTSVLAPPRYRALTTCGCRLDRLPLGAAISDAVDGSLCQHFISLSWGSGQRARVARSPTAGSTLLDRDGDAGGSFVLEVCLRICSLAQVAVVLSW